MLKNGTSAPAFSLLNHSHTEVSLDAYKGKVICLIFLRGRFCPTTDRYLTAYQDFYKRLKELNVVLLAISSDSTADNAALAENFRIKFPILSDPDFAVSERYGLYRGEHKGKPFAEPGLVLIDIDGNVCYSVLSSGPKGLPSPGDVAPVLLYMHFHEGRY